MLLALLVLRVLKPEQIRESADFLQSGIAFFLIPVMVGLMSYVDLIMENAVAFFAICLVSTVLTFGAVGQTSAPGQLEVSELRSRLLAVHAARVREA